MRIVLFCSAYNGLTQRIDRELAGDGHQVFIELSPDAAVMKQCAAECAPDLIICPFLKHRVPESIWQRVPCLIVHPGIEGDRGPSSLDWAIVDGEPVWGVTLLQADMEMDAGDIWATDTFPMREAPKAALYRREVTATASRLVRDAVARFAAGTIEPRPLQPNHPQVHGRWRELMRQGERRIDWQHDRTEAIVRKIRAADSAPGVRDAVNGHEVHLYGVEADGPVDAAPGQWVSHCDGAMRRATVDGSVWIRQVKRATDASGPGFKLPAYQVSTTQCGGARLPEEDNPRVRAIAVDVRANVAWVRFDFAGGAMDTAQCRALLRTLQGIRECSDVDVVVLLGGDDFWGNGIHLTQIEAADSAARESWDNINAMDDLVREIIDNRTQVTIAALGNNAGAGGAIMPLACDRVWCRDGVVLNPHYATMGLYGSEYWTYLLPRRVGQDKAASLMRECLPVVAGEAEMMGLVDEVFAEPWTQYQDALRARVQALADHRGALEDIIAIKCQRREHDEGQRPLADYRRHELAIMKACFDDPDSEYHRLRHEFVCKVSSPDTPSRLRRREQPEKAAATS